MSYQKQEYTDISDLLLKGTDFPTNIGSYEGQHTQPCSPGDPITIGDTVEVKASKEKLRITVEVEIHGANNETSSSIEDAVSSIQLLGTKKQVLLIHGLLEEMKQSKTADVGPMT